MWEVSGQVPIQGSYAAQPNVTLPLSVALHELALKTAELAVRVEALDGAVFVAASRETGQAPVLVITTCTQ
jgi:hypothetical protein